MDTAARPDANASTMRAWRCRRYGGPDVLRIETVAKPVPNDDEVLVQVLATTVTSGDHRVRSLDVPKGLGTIARLALGVRRPRRPILGTELAGIVAAVGSRVTRFAPGDEVFAFPGVKMGAHAEYCAIAADGPIADKPEHLSFEEAAALCFGGSAALHFLRKADLRRGERILILGASGNVGTAMVQLAKHMGAEVTGVTSTANVELVASLGADHVIDRTQQDPSRATETYDVVADTVGASTFAHAAHTLRDGGRYLAIAGGMPDMLAALRTAMVGGKRAIAGPAEERPSDVAHLADLAAKGLFRPIIDRTYAFSEMREAHAYVATGRKRGSVVVRVVS